jgi:LacI family transcriptional regulator
MRKKVVFLRKSAENRWCRNCDTAQGALQRPEEAEDIQVPDSPRVLLLLYPYAGYDRGILQGIARYSQIHGPWFLYLAGEEAGLPLPDLEAVSGEAVKTFRVGDRKSIRLPDLRRWGVTGIIGRLQSPEITRTVIKSGAPMIVMDVSDDERRCLAAMRQSHVSEIEPDSYQAGKLAAEHLLERGLKHFAFCGFEGRGWSDRRQRGFCKRLEECGFSCQVYQPPKSRGSLLWQRERPKLTDWLRGLPKPLGVMACNDNRGRQAIEAATLGGMAVPDQVAIVGVDDDQLLCELSNPPLSSVVLNAEKGGYQAAELLDKLMARKTKHQQILVEPLWVVARRSTEAMAVGDAKVAAAMRFIREKGREPIGVDNVVAQVGISRRALEIRFHGTIGHSIREEIKRVRLKWVKQLLLETNLPTAKIAEVSGFNSLSYLSKVFHKEMSETLSQYRRRQR